MWTEIIIIMVVFAVISGYIITSVLLMKFPHILHKKKKLKFRPVHISHRGGAGENIENTMTAYRHALAKGSDMLEIDCHITKDGQVVVSHDATLKRSCGIDSLIADNNYDDLPLLIQDRKLDFYPEFTLSGSDDRKIPLLQEVFEAFPNIPINIDIKINDDELIEKVNGLIKEFNREELTAWGNFSSVIANKLYKVNPSIPLIFSIRKVIALVVLFYTGLLPFVPLRESCLEIIMPSIVFDIDEEKAPIKLSKPLKCLLRTVDVLLMSPVLFNHLRRRGIQTYFWVLNEDQQFSRAFKVGADGVMTDFPTKLTEFLEAHPKYRTQRSDV